MSQTLPLHADTVGSYLRTAPLKQARADFAEGKISREALTQVEDQEIAKLVEDQLAKGVEPESRPMIKRGIAPMPVSQPMAVNAPNSVFALGTMAAAKA